MYYVNNIFNKVVIYKTNEHNTDIFYKFLIILAVPMCIFFIMLLLKLIFYWVIIFIKKN